MAEVLQPTKLKWGATPSQAVRTHLTPSSLSAQPPKTVDDLLKARAATIPDAPIVGYPDIDNGRAVYVYYSPSDLDRFVNGAISTLVVEGLPTNVCHTGYTYITHTDSYARTLKIAK